jgi:hypothetical protein
MHGSIKVGTLDSILQQVQLIEQLSRDELLAQLFGGKR